MSHETVRKERPPVRQEKRQRLAALGGVIRNERVNRNVTQKSLARAIGYAGPSTICKIEKGAHATLDVKTVYAILDQLGIPVTSLENLGLDLWRAS